MFPTLDKPDVDKYENLNDDQKKKIVDYITNGYGATYISHSKELAELDEGHMVPLSVSKWAIQKVQDIYNSILANVKASDYSDIQELKTNSFKDFPNCSQEAFYYTVDKVISESTVEGTLVALKNYFNSLPTE